MCGIFAVHRYGTEEELKAFRPRALVRSPRRLRPEHRHPLSCVPMSRCSRNASVTAARTGPDATRRVTASSATSVSPSSESVSPAPFSSRGRRSAANDAHGRHGAQPATVWLTGWRSLFSRHGSSTPRQRRRYPRPRRQRRDLQPPHPPQAAQAARRLQDPLGL